MTCLAVILGELDHLGEVPEALRKQAGFWLATTPGGLGALESARMPFAIPEDLVSPAEVEVICTDSYEDLRKMCRHLDNALPGLAGIFSAMQWDLGARIDGILWRSCVLDRLSKVATTTELVCWPPARGVSPPAAFEVTWGHSDWANVLAHMPGGTGRTADLHRDLPPSSWSREIAFRLRNTPLSWSALQLWRQGFGAKAIARLATGRGSAWLMLKAPYDWQQVLRDAARSGKRIIFDEPDRYFGAGGASTEDVGNLLGVIAAAWEDFVARRPAFARAALLSLGHEIRRIAASAPAVLPAMRAEVARTIARFEVDVVLNAIGSSLREQTVLAAYRDAGVPVIKWQHGSVWWNHRINQRMDDSDLATADLHLVYGPETKRAYRNAGHHMGCRVAVVGSSRLDKLRQTTPAPSHGPRHVLYSATGVYGAEWYCGFSPPFLDGLYARHQADLVRRLLRLLAGDQEMSLTVKLAPNASGKKWPAWINEAASHIRCRVVVTEATHAGLLPLHDTVVLDCATTTLLETLCTSAFVYVLLGAPGWPEAEVRQLALRAVCADSPASLVESLALHRRSGRYDADPLNANFMQRHAVNGSSVEEVHALVAGLTRTAVGRATGNVASA